MLGRLQHYDLGSLLIGIVDLDRRHLRIAQEVVRGAVVNDILQVVGPAAVAFFIMQFLILDVCAGRVGPSSPFGLCQTSSAGFAHGLRGCAPRNRRRSVVMSARARLAQARRSPDIPVALDTAPSRRDRRCRCEAG
jgi:hypothetical protein